MLLSKLYMLLHAKHASATNRPTISCLQMRDEMKKLAALKPTVASYLQEQENLKGSDGAREQVGAPEFCPPTVL